MNQRHYPKANAPVWSVRSLRNQWVYRPVPDRAKSFCLAMIAPVLWLSACCLEPAWAQVATDDLAADQMLVRELMRLDAALALRRVKDQAREYRKSSAAPLVVPDSAQNGDLRLLAIYGVGKKLRARVRHGEKTFLYRRGTALPVGVRHAEKSIFTLRGMSGSCVSLGRGDVSRTLCLPPSLWAGQR